MNFVTGLIGMQYCSVLVKNSAFRVKKPTTFIELTNKVVKTSDPERSGVPENMIQSEEMVLSIKLFLA